MNIFDSMVPTKFHSGEVVCFDVRKFDSVHSDYQDTVWDLKMLYGGKNLTFERLALNVLGDRARPLWDLKEKVKAHLKAATAAGIDVKLAPMRKLVDEELWKEYVATRKEAMLAMYVDKYEPAITIREQLDYRNLLRLRRALNIVENTGIMVDVKFLNELADDDDPVVSSFGTRAKKHLNGSYLETKFNPNPGVTGRLGIEDGFAAMSIPHGICRRSIVSRFAGFICVFDYNAMDFRSIIKMADSPELDAFYASSVDFHAKTAELVFGDPFMRDDVKAFLYPLFYGGTAETVAAKGKFSVARAHELESIFRSKMPQLFSLKSKLEEKARLKGTVVLPTGKEVLVSDPSKAFALAGQSLSSEVFREALIAVVELLKGYCSKVIFTVHDEIVIDMHPSEMHLIAEIEKIMKESIKGYFYEVKHKIGRNYAEASK